PSIRSPPALERWFARFRRASQLLLTALVSRRFLFVPVFFLLCLSAVLLVPWLGQDFFPTTDSGQFLLHLRAKNGTRLEETARLWGLFEDAIRRGVSPEEKENILDNIGLPYSTINFTRSTSGVIGAADADIMVSLTANHRPTAEYVRTLRQNLPSEFPGTTFYFLPADIITQILNFGLPAPID